MGFLLTIFLLFGSSLKGIASWRKRTSKEHIDTYFLRIAEIETSLMQKDSPVTTQELSEKLQRMEIQAYQDLIEERLSANNSYLIFLSMLTRANEKIRARSDQSSMD